MTPPWKILAIETNLTGIRDCKKNFWALKPQRRKRIKAMDDEILGMENPQASTCWQ